MMMKIVNSLCGNNISKVEMEGQVKGRNCSIPQGLMTYKSLKLGCYAGYNQLYFKIFLKQALGVWKCTDISLNKTILYALCYADDQSVVTEVVLYMACKSSEEVELRSKHVKNGIHVYW